MAWKNSQEYTSPQTLKPSRPTASFARRAAGFMVMGSSTTASLHFTADFVSQRMRVPWTCQTSGLDCPTSASESPTVPDEIKPWTIRNVPPDVRNAALSAAKRRGVDIGELVSRALLSDIQAERQEQRAPAVVRPAPIAHPAATTMPPLDLAGSAQFLAGLAQLIGTLGGVPDGLRRDTERTTRAMLRQARRAIAEQSAGLPPARVRRSAITQADPPS